MKLRHLAWITALLPTISFGQQVHVHEHAPPDDKSSVIEEILVIGHPLSGEGIAHPVDVMEKEELERKASNSIGETVGGEPGIHSSSYGVAVGRPVIHGLDGARVKVLEDRIDAMDVSVTSGDHATTVEPFIADRVEIFKGSGTLMYGSGAIGGVVDVHTGRVPHNPMQGVSGKFDLRSSNNSNARNGAFRVDGGTGNFAWHADGFSRNAGDYEIPGYAESALLRAMEHDDDHDDDDDHEAEGDDDHEADHDDDHDDDHEAEEEAYGVLPGSSLDVQGGAAGFSFVGERGHIGVSVSRLNAEYGIPGHAHDHDEEGEEEHHDEEGEEGHHEEEEEEGHGHDEEGTPIINMEQTRIDFEAALGDPLPGFKSLNLRLGINDYMHDEVEPSGEVGTAFENDAWEARVELIHNHLFGWEGVFGTQLGDRTFSVAGEEAFVPPVDTRSLGVFWVGERTIQQVHLEAGIRFDTVEHDPANGDSKDFSGFSASFGSILKMDDTWKATVLADFSTRMPVGEELFADGPHLATASFEIGDDSLTEEVAFNLSGTMHGRGPNWSLLGTVYYTLFSDFIFLMDTGMEMEGLHVLHFNQADATFTGAEVEATLTIADWGSGKLGISGMFDTVSASIDVHGNDNLPRIPPSRAGLGLNLSLGRFTASLDYVHAFEQEDVAPEELVTPGYNDLDADFSWDIVDGSRTVSVYLQGRNLTDATQRKHTSIIKDLAPDPGQTVAAGIRVQF